MLIRCDSFVLNDLSLVRCGLDCSGIVVVCVGLWFGCSWLCMLLLGLVLDFYDCRFGCV